MIGRKPVHEKLKVVPTLHAAGRHQLLYQLEHRYNMAFSRFRELRDQKDDRGQKSFCGIVEEGVLPVGGGVAITVDERLGDDLCILLGFCFVCHIAGCLLIIAVFIF